MDNFSFLNGEAENLLSLVFILNVVQVVNTWLLLSKGVEVSVHVSEE